MDAEKRAEISRFIRNIIAPGNRAFLSYELSQTIKDVVIGYPIYVGGNAQPLGKYWLNNENDPFRKQKIEKLKGLSKWMYRAYKENSHFSYDDELVSLFYTIYYLPRNIHKIQFVLLKLFEEGLLPQKLCVLDIGTGVGTVPLALADFMILLEQACKLFEAEVPHTEVNIFCMDESQNNLEFLEKLIARFGDIGRNLHVQKKLTRIDHTENWLAQLPNDEKFDLIFFSNILNELTEMIPSKRADLVLKVVPWLAPHGFLIVIEPADQENSKAYHQVQHELSKNGLTLNFPCAHLHAVHGIPGCSDCWAYRSEKLRIPDFLKPLIWSPGKEDRDEEKIQWCYGIFGHKSFLTSPTLTSLCSSHDSEERKDFHLQLVSPPLLNGRYFKVCGMEGRSTYAILHVGEYQLLPPVSYGDIIYLKNVRTVKSTTQFPVELEILFDSQSEFENISAYQTEVDPLTINEPEQKTAALRYFLQRLFGFEDFRPGQLEVIHKVFTKQDVLVVMATSAGKSLCFQFPAMLLPGVVLVVAPLLSLVQDQLINLRWFGFDHVQRINSELTAIEREEVLDRLTQGYYKLVYITPEQLMNERVILKLQETARNQGISLFAIDEVHCLSQWGHDFRPAYLNLRRHFSEINKANGKQGRTPLLALTATASDYVIEDVLTNLDMPDTALQRHSFDRPELSFEVVKTRPSSNRVDMLLKIIREKLQQVLSGHTRPGIIFVPYTGENLDSDSDWWVFSAEGLAAELNKYGFQVACYHSDLDMHEREERQKEFKEGKLDVLVATKGFGMGIDKGDIRFIIHFSMPDSLESYYQQAGRSGRDNQHSHCVLLYEYPDIKRKGDNSYRTDFDRQMYFIEANYPNSPDDIRQVWEYLRSASGPRKSLDGKLIYQDRDQMIVGLGWMTSQEMESARRESEYKSFRDSLIREWTNLLNMLLGKTMTHVKAQTIGRVEDAKRKHTNTDWGILLKRNEREILIQKLSKMFNSEKIAAIADIMSQKPNRKVIKQKSEVDKRHKVILDALRRMKFIYSWDTVRTKATFERRLSWDQIEAQTCDSAVRKYINRIRASNQTNPDSVSIAPQKFYRSVNLVDLSFKYGLDVIQIHAVYDYLRQLNLLKNLKYSKEELIIRIEDSILQLPIDQINLRLEESISLLYQRKQRQIDMLDSMQRYIDTTSCRRQSITGYFLQHAQSRVIVRCNFCDNCCPSGIKGERANVEEATHRQAEIINQIQVFLEKDVDGISVYSIEDASVAYNFAAILQPQDGETQIWDLVHSMCAFHLENRNTNSLRALLLMVILEFEQGNYSFIEHRIDRFKSLLKDRWLELETIASELYRYPNQYFTVEFLYEAKVELNRPLYEQMELLNELVGLDYDRNPDYLNRLGQIEYELGLSGFEDHYKDALAGWARSSQINKTVQRIVELVIELPIEKVPLPVWVEIVASHSSTKSLELLNKLIRLDGHILVSEISKSLLRIQPYIINVPDALLDAADIARQLGDFVLVEIFLKGVIEHPNAISTSELMYKTHTGLGSIYAPDAPLANPVAFEFHMVEAARIASDEISTIDIYRRLIHKWNDERLLQEIIFNEEQGKSSISSEILKFWLQGQPGDIYEKVTCSILASKNRVINWQVNSASEILDLVQYSILEQFPDLLVWRLNTWGEQPNYMINPVVFTNLLLQLKYEYLALLKPSHYALLGEFLFEKLSDAQLLDVWQRVDREKTKIKWLYNQIRSAYLPETLLAIGRWIETFDTHILITDRDSTSFILSWIEDLIKTIDEVSVYQQNQFRQRLTKFLKELSSVTEWQLVAFKTRMRLCQVWPEDFPDFFNTIISLQQSEVTIMDESIGLLSRNKLVIAFPGIAGWIPNWISILAARFPEQAFLLLQILIVQVTDKDRVLIGEALRYYVEGTIPSLEIIQNIVQIADQLTDPNQEEFLWLYILSLPAKGISLEQRIIFKAHSSLVKLYQRRGALTNSEVLRSHALYVARNSPNWEDALPVYRSIITDWKWEEISAEAISIEQKWSLVTPHLKLLAIWLTCNKNEEEHIKDYVTSRVNNDEWSFRLINILNSILNTPLIDTLELVAEWSAQIRVNSLLISKPEKFLEVIYHLSFTDHKLSRELISYSKAIYSQVLSPDQKEAVHQNWFLDLSSIDRFIDKFFDIGEDLPLTLTIFWLEKFDSAEFVSRQPRMAEKAIASINAGFSQIQQNASLLQNLHHQVGGLVDEMIENPITRSYAHDHWVQLCTFWPEEAVLHMRHCLILKPPEVKFAEECLDLIMSYNKDTLILELVQLLKQKDFKGLSNRIDRLIDLLNNMRNLEINSDITTVAKLEPRHLAMIFNIFKPKDDPFHADMASELIKLLRERIYSNWKTPLAYQVEALVYGNHIDDARKITEPSLTIGKERILLDEFIKSISKRLLSVPDYRNDYYKVLFVLTSRWKCRQP